MIKNKLDKPKYVIVGWKRPNFKFNCVLEILLHLMVFPFNLNFKFIGLNKNNKLLFNKYLLNNNLLFLQNKNKLFLKKIKDKDQVFLIC